MAEITSNSVRNNNNNRNKNNYNKMNSLLNIYEDNDKIYLNIIICNKYYIDKNNNEFCIFKECNNNVCPICNDKNHIIIKYDDENYLCKQHNESHIKYCFKCKEIICLSCENKHNNHFIFDLGRILINKMIY